MEVPARADELLHAAHGLAAGRGGNDGLCLSAVRGLAFQPLTGDGHTIQLDEMQLER